MNKDELVARIAELSKEKRSIADGYLNPENKVEDLDKRSAEVSKELEQRKMELAQLDMPKGKEEKRSAFNSESWVKSAKENRGITIGDAGSVLQIKNIVNEVAANDDLLNAASFYYGANASTNIPVLTPLSDPTAQAEGSTGVGTDSDAAVTVTKLEPYAYARVLPVSAEMLTMGSVNLEAEVPGIFQKAFRKVIHQQMLTGDGSTGNFRGLFKSALDNSAASKNTIDGVTIANLAQLAITVRALDEDYTIVMNPAFYQALMSEAAATGDDSVKLYKESLIRDKTIEGVKVLIDSKAPSATTSDAVAIVAAPLSRFAIGVAGEMTVDPIKVKGDTNTYFQATMFINGKQVADSDVYGIINA